MKSFIPKITLTGLEDNLFYGNCNHCSNYFENLSQRAYWGKPSDERLALIVEAIKKSGRDREHDCVLGISGGVDGSSMRREIPRYARNDIGFFGLKGEGSAA